ncbi:MAG: DUF3793 family protein [Elusimicrobia bacterium]|nr:DUF3793 family protein [Elusimicrobiota bacterium]
MQKSGRGACRCELAPGPGLPGAAEVMALMARLRGRELLSAWLRYFLGATLYASKPGTLLSVGEACGLAPAWRAHGPECVRRLGLEFRVMHSCRDAQCVLFYRPAALRGFLALANNAAYLRECGYGGLDLNACLDRLSRRFAGGCPHELGVFLGIPAAEVRAFSSPFRPAAKAAGYWQVFVDLKNSLEKFAEYDTAFRRACREVLECAA